jgi:magnesium chelatase family protein
LRPVRGALALALALRRGGCPRTLVLPAASARTAAQVPGLDVRAAVTLAEVVAALLPGDAAQPLPAAEPWPRRPPPPGPDLRDVKGQAAAKRALEIAAAGAHSLLLVGPPGTGKSMLAQRLPGLLPPLDEDEALASTALAGLTSAGVEAPPTGQRPVREPLETGHITISRAARQALFPARFQLVAAMNPCPCGWLGVPAGLGRACRCTPDAVARYQGRLSGPLLDRIDLQVEVLAATPAELMALPDGDSSATVAEALQLQRVLGF